MSGLNAEGVVSRPRMSQFPWLIFFFIAVIFLLYQHDFYISKNAAEAFNPTEQDLLARGAVVTLKREVFFFSLGLFALADSLWFRRAWPRINGLLGWAMLVFAGWAVGSIAWSDDVTQTIKRLASYGMFALAGAALSRRCSLRQIVLMTFSWSLLFLGIGLFFELLLGTFRPFAPGYRFAGTLHPNSQGINCAILFLSGLAAADMNERRRRSLRFCALLGILFLILTASRTAFAAALIAICVYWGKTWSSRLKGVVISGSVVLFCTFFLFLGSAARPALQNAVMLGRHDSTPGSFNGRTGIWEDVEYYIEQRPLLGYGFDSFWTEHRIMVLSKAETWGMDDAHSAYLECLLELGFVGFATYLIILLTGICWSFALRKTSRTPDFAFCGALLTFCLIDGIFESAAIRPTILAFLATTVLFALASWKQKPDMRRCMDHGSSRNYRRRLYV